MKVVLAYIGYPVSAGKYTKKALKNMGYDVIHVGPYTGGQIPWKPEVDYSGYADKPDIILPWTRAYPVEVILEQTGPVDLVLEMDANFYLTGRAPIPQICWMQDNHVNTYDLAENCNVLFGAHSWGYRSGDARFVWMPCAYSPSDHYQTRTEREHDLAFVGVPYNNRVELLAELAKHGDVVAAVGLMGKEYNDAYNTARMGLCASICGDVPMRVLENAAQGLLVFCDRQKDLEKLGLKDGEHYMGFDSTAEATEKFKWLLRNPAAVQRIAKTGKEALRKETYEQRITEMLSYL